MGSGWSPPSSGGQRKAGGGRVRPGSYWVGEKGPEVFRTGVSGSITPNHALQGRGGGISIVQHIALHGVGAVEEVKRALRDVGQELEARLRGIHADTGLEFS
jgi:hypothetical protein